MKLFTRQKLLVLGILSSGLSFAHTSYEQKVECPIDGKKFTINVTMSYTTFNTLLDYQKQGAIGDLYESAVNSCPKCHYSGYQSDLDTVFSEKEKLDILQILEPYKDSHMDDVLENEIAVKIHQYFKKDNDDIANLYLIASYYLRNNDKQIAKRKELQRNSAIYFAKAIESKEYEDKETYATIDYLIGELFRRTGDFENAIKYYESALQNEDKPDWIPELVNAQKELALKKDENNSI